MNVIKIDINNNKTFIVCSMPQNSTISQIQHMKLLPGVVTMVTMKTKSFYIRFISQQLLNDQPCLIRLGLQLNWKLENDI